MPAVAVIQRGQALNMMTGRKGCVGGNQYYSLIGMIAYRRKPNFAIFFLRYL